ncbi:hypothetical protein ABZ353_35420 [Streptomyces niveus]|uniref:hypothetical protein n=1 Tax=Streptomyces niveus TaxID=193462 RepID=UPI0033E4D6D5
MRRTRLTTAVLATALGLAGALATGPVAGAAARAGCQYKVVWPTAGVYETPADGRRLRDTAPHQCRGEDQARR